jgi:hypothetical protein
MTPSRQATSKAEEANDSWGCCVPIGAVMKAVSPRYFNLPLETSSASLLPDGLALATSVRGVQGRERFRGDGPGGTCSIVETDGAGA